MAWEGPTLHVLEEATEQVILNLKDISGSGEDIHCDQQSVEPGHIHDDAPPGEVPTMEHEGTFEEGGGQDHWDVTKRL